LLKRGTQMAFRTPVLESSVPFSPFSRGRLPSLQSR
jgi:hypothetical protein